MSDVLEKYKEADLKREEKGGQELMDKGFNLGITAVILVSIILLCACVGLYITKENEVEKRIFIERQLEDISRDKKGLEAELEKLKAVKIDTELKLAIKEKEVEVLQDRLESLKAERIIEKGERSNLAEELSSLQGEYAILKTNFDQLQETKEMLEQKLKEAIRSGVKLKTIIVGPEKEEKGPEAGYRETAEPASTSAQAKPTVTGEVLAVNKEYEFLVISLGANNGITADSEVSIYKGDELIAQARVEKLYDNISAVIINDKAQLDKVKVGNTAVGTVEKNR